MTTQIDVRAANRRGLYTAVLAGRDICTSRQPFLDAARVLLDEGIAPETVLERRWAESGTVSLRAAIGIAYRFAFHPTSYGRKLVTA
jgi:hypothetical protein